MNQETVASSFFGLFILGVIIILCLNDPKANAIELKYYQAINNPSNAQTEVLKVSAHEEHLVYNLLLRMPSNKIEIYFEGYKGKYEVPYIYSKAVNEGSEFNAKYVLVDNEKCIISIESAANPDFKVSLLNLQTSKNSDHCKLLQ